MDTMQDQIIDPVCGEQVDPEESLYQARYCGQTYHFCGLNCQLDFQEAPEQYVGRHA